MSRKTIDQNITGTKNQRILEEALPPLLSWYEKERRLLPWREEPTAYHVWVSEIMLQQTRVEAVKAYYQRFMECLPTVEALGNCPDDDLHKLWEGLGYYSRVRNLKKAAITILTEYDGKIPSEEKMLLSLTGIGSYTAAAIASIAFGKNAAAVDGNVLRVITRLLAREEDIGGSQFKNQIKELLENAYSVVAKNMQLGAVSGSLNQAFMDLGSSVCLPNTKPKCTVCPMATFCKAHKSGKELCYPVKAEKKPRVIEKRTVLLIYLGERILLHKRPGKGLLAGLYEFPNLEGHLSPKKVLAYVESLGMTSLHIEKLSAAKHIFTHKEWHMIGYSIKADEIRGEQDLTKEELFQFVTPEELKDGYAVPSAFSAYRP